MRTLTKAACIDMTQVGIINLQCCQRQIDVFVQDKVKLKNIKARLPIVFNLANPLISRGKYCTIPEQWEVRTLLSSNLLCTFD